MRAGTGLYLRPLSGTDSVLTSKELTLRTAQQGYTLIELMVVTGIVGILGSIAIPAYQDYTIRAQVAEGLALSAGAKAAMVDYFNERGDWPENNNKADMVNHNDIVGKYVRSVKVKKNVIEVMFGNDAHKILSNKKITIEAVELHGHIKWNCSAQGALEDRYLPRGCR